MTRKQYDTLQEASDYSEGLTDTSLSSVGVFYITSTYVSVHDSSFIHVPLSSEASSVSTPLRHSDIALSQRNQLKADVVPQPNLISI